MLAPCEKSKKTTDRSVLDQELPRDILYSSPVCPATLSRSEGPVTDLTCTGDAVGAFRSAETKRDNGECLLGYEVYPFVGNPQSHSDILHIPETSDGNLSSQTCCAMFAGDFP